MDERIQKYEEKMKKTLASLESELVTIRAGRANPHILDKLAVDYYGAPTPGGKYHCPGSSYDPDPAMGKQPDQRN